MAKRSSLIALGSVMVAFLSGCALSQVPPLIPREVLFGHPDRTNPQISPDGKYLSYLAPDSNNVMQIWVRGLRERDDRPLTSEKIHSIWHYTWTYQPNKLIFAQDNAGDENWEIHSVDIHTGAIKNLTPYKGVQSRLV
ncbi:MAG TPA: S9 family peptidase, partial [Candidatus Binatia bacterium]|nr:S9 family peptidase [Candidatus Binatia bacterium]